MQDYDSYHAGERMVVLGTHHAHAAAATTTTGRFVKMNETEFFPKLEGASASGW